MDSPSIGSDHGSHKHWGMGSWQRNCGGISAPASFQDMLNQSCDLSEQVFFVPVQVLCLSLHPVTMTRCPFSTFSHLESF